MPKYRSIKIVTAVPMIKHDFLMGVPIAQVPNLNSFAKGYKITDANGKSSWISKDEFEREFQEIGEDDNG